MWLSIKACSCWLSITVVFYILLVVVVLFLENLAVTRLPDNYQWRAEQAIRIGDLNLAEKIAETAIDREYYDFGAQSLLASVYLEQENTTAALTLLKESLAKIRKIAGREVYTENYEPRNTIALLAQALQANGQPVYASEMRRWHYDLETLATPLIESQQNPMPPPTTPSAKLDTVQWIPITQFNIGQGIVVTQDGTLQFKANAKATLSMDAVTTTVTHLLLEVRGDQAMGVGALLNVSYNDLSLAELYINSPATRMVELTLASPHSQHNLRLTLEFLNHQIDPVTLRERNVEVLRIGIL